MENEQQNVEVEAVEATEPLVTFNDFGFKPQLMKSIEDAGFKVPSPIQEKAMPFVSDGRDIVAQAHTGTGKTAAFGLPILNKMTLDGGVETLVITPTRELANQVADELFKYGRNLGIRTVTVYGGSSYNRQLDMISRGAQVVIATPGRLLDILKKGLVKNFNPTTIVLDEADEMLDMGFLDDINEIFTYVPKVRQTLLFSATMPMPIKKLAERILDNPEFITVTNKETTNKDISQEYYVIDERERDDAIIRLMDASNDSKKSIVFCRTKKEVDRLSIVLSAAGYTAKGLHGDMEQRSRESVIKGLKDGAIDVLIATDVAARGLHIDDISHVYNYHIPFEAEAYVHRIGRTGRAGTKGLAITLVTPHEFRELQRIKSKVGTTMVHAFIPSKHDVKEKTLNKLIASIENQKVYDEAHKVLDALKEEYDHDNIAYKLISMLLDNQNIQGPNHIGLDQARLTKILENLDRNGRSGGGGGGRRHGGGGGGYRGNRSRSGGGGGYRGNNDRNSGGGGSDRNSGGGGYRGNSDRNNSGGNGGGGYRGKSGSSDRPSGGGGRDRNSERRPQN
ncbi:MAG: DEAD/DEAH box helicase [Helicobacteraceae bacterium]|nr:DEAD/DEAH box helicase [Helicobacteraceae bacterium]